MTDAATQFDVFLSHSSADKSAVESPAQRPLAASIRPWLDSWNLIPGDPWQEGLEEALDTCATCAVFLGPSSIGPWHNEELRAALDRRARDRTRGFQVIPVLLPGADPADPDTLPRFLGRMTWVDFRGGLDDAEAFRRLLAGIRGVPPGPAPTAKPESSLQAVELVDARRPTEASNPVLPTPSERDRLKAELARLQTQYDTWTRRIVALDTDISRTLGSLEKQVLEERRDEVVAEREKTAGQIQEIEAKLNA
jgi:hypothetical protein